MDQLRAAVEVRMAFVVTNAVTGQRPTPNRGDSSQISRQATRARATASWPSHARAQNDEKLVQLRERLGFVDP